MYSIWKDINVDLAGSNGSEAFTIRMGGADVYTGTAYEDTDGEYIIRINDIVAYHLAHSLSYFASLPTTLVDTFILLPNLAPAVIVYNSGEPVFNDNVVMDWSYDREFSPDTDTPAAPINGRIDPRMPLIRTSPFAGGSIVADLYAITGDFYVGDYNNDYSGSNIHDTYNWDVESVADLILSPATLSDYQWVVIENDTYKVVRACNRFALYYVNAYGGVDFLLMEGNCTVEDSLTRYSTKKKYDNAIAANRGKKEYLVDAVKTYTLRTGLLTDDEASRMFHLLESCEVYLYDMQGVTDPDSVDVPNMMHPVVITNSVCEYKTYKSNGRKMVQYEINVELAQERHRRG